jgi:hypothetical protein
VTKDEKRRLQEACEHEHLAKEVLFGQKTGDKVCIDCGEAFAPGEKIVPVAEREKPQ